MVFTQENNDFRTDENFRTRHCANHHITNTQMAIEKLPIDIVQSQKNVNMGAPSINENYHTLIPNPKG